MNHRKQSFRDSSTDKMALYKTENIAQREAYTEIWSMPGENASTSTMQPTGLTALTMLEVMLCLKGCMCVINTHFVSLQDTSVNLPKYARGVDAQVPLSKFNTEQLKHGDIARYHKMFQVVQVSSVRYSSSLMRSTPCWGRHMSGLQTKVRRKLNATKWNSHQD